MGMIVIRRNPMDPADREEFAHDGPLIDFLLDRFPRGFPGPTSVVRNGSRILVPDFDVPIGPGDEVYILTGPQGPLAAVGITLKTVGAALAAAAVSTALSYVASWLRGAPDTPDAATPQTPSPTYSLSTPTNQARLGETMPVVYGSVLTVPDIISQPYTYYENNEQFIAMILGVGRGEHAVNHILVSDTSVDKLPAGVFQWWNYPPSVHQQRFQHIQTETGIYEDIDTSAEVSNQELDGTTSTGPFNTNRLGTLTQRLGFDFVFPAGIHAQDGSGNLISLNVDITLEVWEIDLNDNETGNYYSTVATFSGDSTTPVRATWWFDIPRGRYKASVHRNVGNHSQVGFESRSIWAGLKAVLLAPVESIAVLYELNTNVELDLAQWTTIGTNTWGLVPSRECNGTLNPRTMNPTFIASDAIPDDIGDKSLYRVLDVSTYSASIDGGAVRCIAEAWASRQVTDPDTPGLLIQCLDDVGGELAAFSGFGTATCTWGLTPISISELVPALTRQIVLLLDATYVSGTSNQAYFDDISVTLTGLGEGATVPVYDDMHLIPVLMKATNGISTDAARRVAINVTKLNADSNPTYNPADAMKDIFTNTSYGGSRPLTELDTDAVEALRVKLSNTAGFNAIFDSQTTVWAAMQQALRPGDAAPTVYGGRVTVVEDVFRPTVAFAFTTATIVDQTLTTSRNFDFDDTFDCYEVEYLNPITFLPEYVRYPVTGDFPENVTFFGCTNRALAEHQAEFLWEKKYWRRKTVSFQTEALGNLPLVGDLISVIHPAANDGVTPENYIVASIRPAGQFSVTIEAIRDADVYSPIPIFTGSRRMIMGGGGSA